MKCLTTKNYDFIAFILFPFFFFFNYFLFFDLIFFSSVLCHLSKLLFCFPSLPSSSLPYPPLSPSPLHLFIFSSSSHLPLIFQTNYLYCISLPLVPPHIIHSFIWSYNSFFPSFLFLLNILIPCTLWLPASHLCLLGTFVKSLSEHRSASECTISPPICNQSGGGFIAL